MSSSRVSAISRFPPELLEEVLSYLVAPALTTEDPTITTTNWHTIRQLASVCRLWRFTALGWPDFWVHAAPVNMSAEALQEFLGRSNQKPLSVELYLGADNQTLSPAALAVLNSASTRITSLAVRINSGASNPSIALNRLEMALQGHAPLLNSLSVSIESPSTYPWLASGNPMIACELPRLFQGEFPALRTLSLRGISTWEENTFRDLEEFTLANADETEGAGTFAPLLRLLHANPQLRSLNVDKALERGWLEPVLPAQTIRLRSLESLTIKSEPRHIRELLSRLALPATTALKLQAYKPVPDLISIEAMLPQDLAHASLRPFNAVTKLSMSSSDTGKSIQGWAPDNRLLVDVTLDEYCYDYASPVIDFPGYIRPFWSQQITHLTIMPGTAPHCMFERGWRSFFVSLPELQELTLVGEPDAAVFDGLNRLATDYVQQTDLGAFPCPKLDTIHIHSSSLGAHTRRAFCRMLGDRSQVHSVAANQVAEVTNVNFVCNKFGTLWEGPLVEVARMIAPHVSNMIRVLDSRGHCIRHNEASDF